MDKAHSALLVVDVQSDFCEGGALAVFGGSGIIGIVNALSSRFERVVLSQDWHPTGHVSFASSWPGQEPYDTVEAGDIAQVLWPEHCIQGSMGADFHPLLETNRASIILRKGFRLGLDSYSCFFENDRTTSTGLDGALRSLAVRELYVVGLATDFCVLYTVLDALRFGYEVFVVEDAVRGVDVPPGGAARALDTMRRSGASLIKSEVLL
jgi:nicotinamidase/pyrazinamidase